jgi:hypothetical protein
LPCAVVQALGAPETLVEFGSSMRYLDNSSDPGIGMSWTDPSFNDTNWSVGAYGVGFEDASGAENLILTDVPTTTRSVYARTVFQISDIDSVGRLLIGADRDDTWAAWINGVEVFRSLDLPSGPLDWNTMPASARESSNAATPDYGPLKDITAVAFPHLQSGDNDLAVAVWNVGPPDYCSSRRRPAP